MLYATMMGLPVGMISFPTAVQGEPAEPARSPSLSWIRLPGAESCIDALALGRAVEGRLGRSVLETAARADLSLEGRVEVIEPGADRYRATVVVVDAEGQIIGERSIESADGEGGCRSLDSPLVLIIAVMVDPDASLSLLADAAIEEGVQSDLFEEVTTGLTGSEPLATDETGIEPDNEADEGSSEGVLAGDIEEANPGEGPGVGDSISEPSTGEENGGDGEEQTRRLSVSGAATFSLGLGHLPGVPLGTSLTLFLDPQRFPPIEITLGGLISATEENGAEAAVRIDQVYGRLAVCVPWELEIVHLLGCGGFGAGVNIARGVHLDLAEIQLRPTVDVVVGVRVLIWPWRRLMIYAGATLVIPLIRDRFTYTDITGNDQGLYEPEPVGGVFEVGLGLNLY